MYKAPEEVQKESWADRNCNCLVHEFTAYYISKTNEMNLISATDRFNFQIMNLSINKKGEVYMVYI